MADQSNGFGRFWRELRRRKVIRIITVYAAAAFVILQLVDIIAQPLQLPAWTMTLVIVLLCIGFIITLLLSWIYDITPEGFKKTESIEVVKKEESQAIPLKRRIKTSDIIIAAMAIIIVILLYPKVFNKDKLKDIKDPDGRISIAVMPFQNITNDTIWNVWQDGIQNELINNLTNSEELKVRQTESLNYLLQSKGFTNYASITPSVASTISQNLDANVFIYGSIKQAGARIRLNAQLIDIKTKDALKSFQIEGLSKEEEIFSLIDSLSTQVKNFLIISKLKKEVSPELKNFAFASTNSPEAYRYFIHGRNSFYLLDYSTASNWYLQAIAVDTNFTFATIMLSLAYINQGLYEEAKKWCRKLYEKRDQMPMQLKIWTDYIYAENFETSNEVIKYLRQLLDIDDQMPEAYYRIGNHYINMQQYDKAIPEYEKALEIYNKWGLKPNGVLKYRNLGIAYHKTGQYKKEKKLYVKAEKDFPDNYVLIYRQAILSLTEADTIETNRYIEKYILIRKDNSASEAAVATNLADIYSEANLLDKAEKYYRQALSLEPENQVRMNNLAYSLIDKDRNINEGLELVDKALELNPDNHYYLDTKGWGLYKQGKYIEALDLLEKSWNLRPVYNHEVYLHIEEVKKAIANQKNN